MTDFEPGKTAEVKLQVDGNKITVWVNGVQKDFEFKYQPFSRYRIFLGIDTRTSNFFAEAFIGNISIE